MGSLVTSIFRDDQRFLALEAEWRSLWNLYAGNASVFGSFEWYQCWWRHFGGNGKSVFVIVVREQNRLLAVAPLMLERSHLRGFPVRTVRFMENGNSLHNDFIADPDRRQVVIEAILDNLVAHDNLWDMVEFKNIPENSDNHRMLHELAARRGLICGYKPGLDSPFIEIRGSWETFYAARTSRCRKTHRNLLNTIEKEGEVRVIRVTTPEEYRKYREAVMDIAVNSWTEEIGDSLATPRNMSFFDNLSAFAGNLGWLDIWLLVLHGRAIAFEYHLRCNGVNHGLRASFHREFARLSPGTILDYYVVKTLFEENGRTSAYDLGGSYDSYKKKWSPAIAVHATTQLFKPSLYSRTLYGVEHVMVPRLRRLSRGKAGWGATYEPAEKSEIRMSGSMPGGGKTALD